MNSIKQQSIGAQANDLILGIKDVGRKLATSAELDPLIEKIGDARYVLLGEASHGTSDYYLWRARLSKRLIQEKGFSFIAVEGDWPDCYRVNRFVKGNDGNRNAYDVLHRFSRWPTWMWANWEIVALAEWLRDYNLNFTPNDQPTKQVGFYGLDVYSLQESMATVIDYLGQNIPEALEAAKAAYLCFEPYSPDGQAYAWGTSMVPESCEEEVVALLQEIRRQTADAVLDGDPEAAFNTEQNAWVIVEAERYYRTMLRGSAESWNVRDYHMADTLDRLMDHYGPDAKAIVWEHNTHIGDARYTDMSRANMVNVGQIVRERHGDSGVLLVGFGSHRGTVIAGNGWGEPMEIMNVPRAISGSWEDILHQAGMGNKLLLSSELRGIDEAMEKRGHRAIGVVYNPRREQRNYVPTVLPDRYDAFLYIDESAALHPLHLEAEVSRPPETYPWGV